MQGLQKCGQIVKDAKYEKCEKKTLFVGKIVHIVGGIKSAMFSIIFSRISTSKNKIWMDARSTAVSKVIRSKKFAIWLNRKCGQHEKWGESLCNTLLNYGGTD